MIDIPFDAIGFDLDGTLLDTHRDLGCAVNHALVQGGFDPVPVDSSKSLIGGGAKIMLARAIENQGGLPDDEFRQLYKIMLAYYGEHNSVHTAPYPGALETLDMLGQADIRMAVVTNKFESFATAILGDLGLISRFVTIIGGDTMGKNPEGHYRAKPLPDPIRKAREACGGGSFAFVGDSSYDVAAARAAHVPVIVAGYGYCDKPPPELGGDAIIESFPQLIPALQGLAETNGPYGTARLATSACKRNNNLPTRCGI